MSRRLRRRRRRHHHHHLIIVTFSLKYMLTNATQERKRKGKCRDLTCNLKAD